MSEQVRIDDEQVRRLKKVSDMIPGGKIHPLVRRAVELWLEVEAPVYIAKFEEARKEIAAMQKRQDVRPVEVIRPSERA